MVLFSTLLCISIATAPTAARKFDYLYQHLSAKDQSILNENTISNLDELDSFLLSLSESKEKKDDNEKDEVDNIKNRLSEEYPDFMWGLASGNSVENISGGTPINVNGVEFPKSEIMTVIANTGVVSEYGGCGPIAIMGMMDYFSRYLGYHEIIQDPTSSADRISLAEDVLRKSKTFELGFKGENSNPVTLMFPWDYESAFNGLLSDYGLKDTIHATQRWTLIGGKQEEYWNLVVKNVNEGMPVTLMTGFNSDKTSPFSSHYTNIVGYETWSGYCPTTKERITKNYLLGRLNWPRRDNIYYCDASILNDATVAIIDYQINYKDYDSLFSYDFSYDFINSNGGGQYFFYEKEASIETSFHKTVLTRRKRCSYIEDEYLVLSPNREGAGQAYLDMEFPDPVTKFTFSAALWGSSEGVQQETFRIQYYDHGWKGHARFDLSTFSKLKKSPKTYKIVLPKETTRFRLLAEHSNPTGDRNKGRIVLDDFYFQNNS